MERFELEQDVVCIMPAGMAWSIGGYTDIFVGGLPVNMQIYRIKQITDSRETGCFDLHLRFYELWYEIPQKFVLQNTDGLRIPKWHCESFRPVKKTSIDVFKGLLAPTPQITVHV